MIQVFSLLWILFLRKRPLAKEKNRISLQTSRKIRQLKKELSGVKVKHFTFQNINLVIGNNFIALQLLAKA